MGYQAQIDVALNPDGVLCDRCGEVAQGHATANGKRLCHGETRDCYTIVTSHYKPRHHVEPDRSDD